MNSRRDLSQAVRRLRTLREVSSRAGMESAWIWMGGCLKVDEGCVVVVVDERVLKDLLSRRVAIGMGVVVVVFCVLSLSI